MKKTILTFVIVTLVLGLAIIRRGKRGFRSES
jgi:hypothetical protein